MSERTEFDDAVDVAIDHLISEDTESFALQVCEGTQTHLVSSQREFDVDQKLLQVAAALMELSELTKKVEGAPTMEPFEVAQAALYHADQTGLDVEDLTE